MNLSRRGRGYPLGGKNPLSSIWPAPIGSGLENFYTLVCEFFSSWNAHPKKCLFYAFWWDSMKSGAELDFDLIFGPEPENWKGEVIIWEWAWTTYSKILFPFYFTQVRSLSYPVSQSVSDLGCCKTQTIWGSLKIIKLVEASAFAVDSLQRLAAACHSCQRYGSFYEQSAALPAFSSCAS